MFTLLATAKPFAARPKLYSIVFLLSAFFSLLGASVAQAASNVNALTAIVSDRSAPTLIAGAHQLLQQHKDIEIRIRTVSQVIAMDDEHLQSLISSSQSLVMIAVFGEAVDRDHY